VFWAGWAREPWLRARRSREKKRTGRPSIATIRELLPDADHAERIAKFERARDFRRRRGRRSLTWCEGIAASASVECWAIVTSWHAGGWAARAQSLAAGDFQSPNIWSPATRCAAMAKPDPRGPYLKGAQLLGVTGGRLPGGRGCSPRGISRRQSQRGAGAVLALCALPRRDAETPASGGGGLDLPMELRELFLDSSGGRRRVFCLSAVEQSSLECQ